ncbi:MAG: dihydroorotate dehydrogenase electron transfer subunit [Bacteroidales bacterium]|nr:dihydroorotate dehydrogenase electron transfer subunit [Bacteroidales bacterium]
MRTEDFRLLKNKRITRDYFVMDIVADQPLPDIMPGQFVQLRVDNNRETFLRRPISVYDTDYARNTISLLIKEVGAGTRAMSQLSEGAVVNLVHPLGNSFTPGDRNSRSLLVGGGVGVAPMLMLGKYFKKSGLDFKFLLGYQSSEHVIQKERYEQYGEVLISTDDGTMGHKGLVTSHPGLLEGEYDRIYCCGPEIMMKKVAGIARSAGKFCEVSLENTMACGYGVCLCCVVETDRGNICTCTEGPVFNINELKWQI